MSDALRQWVQDQSGLTAIWTHQDAPRPERPYCGLQIINVATVGVAAREHIPDLVGMRDITIDREVVVSVNVYESANNTDPRAALVRAVALRDTLELVTVRHELKMGGWAVRGVELLTDAPAQLGTQWEPRAIFDVRFGTADQVLEDVGLIETVEITASVRDTDYSNTINTKEV